LTVLHAAAPARAGGLEKVIEALSVGLAERGHAIHVAAVVERADDAQHFLAPLAERGVHTHPIVLPGRAYRQERAAIRRLCEQLRPAALHTHGYRSDVGTLGIAKGVNVATVSTVHGFTGGSLRNRIYEQLQILAFRRIDAVVAVSKPLETLLRARGVSANRLHLIPNAFRASAPLVNREEARKALGIDANARQVVWLGRLTHEKGADVLLRAIPNIDPSIRVSFVGDGRERAALLEVAKQLGVEARIDWHGLVANAGRFLRAFDGYVLSSRTEGTPIALFEAMSAELAIVATRVGGVPDVVGDAEALLVPSENPDALAQAINAMFSDPTASTQRASRALQRLSTSFGVDPWLDAYVDLYRQVQKSR
jgi:glycosyltransferase involved in cell wall biosynthesis